MEGGHPIAERSWSQDFIFKCRLRKECTDSGELLSSADLTKLSSVMDDTEDILPNRIGRTTQLRTARMCHIDTTAIATTIPVYML